jgi:hypothetical protein
MARLPLLPIFMPAVAPPIFDPSQIQQKTSQALFLPELTQINAGMAVRT